MDLQLLALCFSIFVLGFSLGRVRWNSSQIPLAPPKENVRWYPLLAHELRANTIYRHRVTGLKVRVSKPGLQFEDKSLTGYGRGAMWNPIKGEWMIEDILDNDLETDDINLAPRAMDEWQRSVERHLKLS